jgi:DNA-binding MarR family transcriptional regulator
MSPQSQAAGADERRSAARWINLVARLSTTTRRLRRLLAARLTHSGLSETDLLLLSACEATAGDGIAQNQLSQIVGASAAQTSMAVERLRLAGLLANRRDDDDRRRQLWRLTADGEAALAKIYRELAPQMELLERAVEPRRRHDCEATLQAIEAALDSPVERATIKAFALDDSQREERRHA